MHYSPLASGIGLFAVSYALPPTSGILVIARVLLVLAGLIFIGLSLTLIGSDLVGRLRSGLRPASGSRPVGYGRHHAGGATR